LVPTYAFSSTVSCGLPQSSTAEKEKEVQKQENQQQAHVKDLQQHMYSDRHPHNRARTATVPAAVRILALSYAMESRASMMSRPE
jgi:hypothetical protein